MNTILQQLYNGEICLVEQYRPILEEYKAIRKKHMVNYKGFIEKLGSPLDKEFINIMDEQFETVPLDFFQMFSDGFKLGAKMMIEVLCSGDGKETAE